MIDILNNTVVADQYNKDNYYITVNNNTPTGVCVIYFSSNDIWSNRYEWKNLRIHKAQKEIFMRDIYKSWYTMGINSKLNSIDAVITFLQKETSGYNVITVGSSAGGYMAALTASLLNAQYALCFSPQFDITSGIKNNPILQKYEKLSAGKYYSITKYIKRSYTRIFYFSPQKFSGLSTEPLCQRYRSGTFHAIFIISP